jgi:type IV pilus assembly protein PilQ
MKGALRLMLLAAIALLALCPQGRAQAAEGPGGPLVSMELRDVEFADIMRAMGLLTGMNIIVDERVKGNYTASLREVPLWEALNTMLRGRGYGYRRLQSGLLIIEPSTSLESQEQELSVREFRLKYLNVSEDVVLAVGRLLSSRGSVSRLPETNSMVIKDIPLAVERAGELLARLDMRPEQILIEGRIVEIRASMKKELGINWWASYKYESSDVLGGLGSTEGAFAVNLPAATEEGLALGVGIISDRFTLDLQLSALEDRGDAKVVSSPRIMVLDNHKARISDGTEILIPTMEAATIIKTGDYADARATKAETFPALLELAVTPRVIDGELISLLIDTRREEFDFSREVQGFPPKLTRTASTELLVRNSETIVIGGIISTGREEGQSRVPVLSSIPLLGRLFKRDLRSEEQRELLIFITPKIMERAHAAKPPEGDIQDKPGR